MLPRLSCSLLALGWLLAASPAGAGTVADLRAALARLSATQPLAATLEVRSRSHGDGQDKPLQASARITVDSDAAGLQLTFAPALLQQAAREAAAHARNKDLPTPLDDLLDKLTAPNVQPMVDFGPELLRLLDGATLASQRDGMLAGQPARLLVFSVPMSPSASRQMTMKSYVGELKVWLGIDGLPLAVDEKIDVHGRKLLVSIDFATTSHYRLRVRGTRLVAVSRHVEESHSVFGHGGGSVMDAALVPLPAKAGD